MRAYFGIANYSAYAAFLFIYDFFDWCGQDWYEFGIFSSRAMGKLVGFAEGFLKNT
jgi:hypothetical protein